LTASDYPFGIFKHLLYVFSLADIGSLIRNILKIPPLEISPLIFSEVMKTFKATDKKKQPVTPLNGAGIHL
jgi:hypothetical protein